ncbi:hypothetical protein LINPERHAP1_LOCUS39558, partial [Linum perenne]
MNAKSFGGAGAADGNVHDTSSHPIFNENGELLLKTKAVILMG